MSRQQPAGAARQAYTPKRRGTSPRHDLGSRAGDIGAPSTGAGRTGAKALLFLAPLILLVVALLARASFPHASADGAVAGAGRESRHALASAAPAIDPRLILTPRTVTQAATAGGIAMAMTAGPLLPGTNHFALRLDEQGRPLAGVHVLLVIRMVGMAMQPVTLPMREVAPGRYAATVPLSMFGVWQVTARIDRPGMAPRTQQFSLGVDLPRGLLTAPAVHGAHGT